MSDDPRYLPRHTTPTWEVELLISGVAVFAMLQLPGLLDETIFKLRPRFGAESQQVILLAYVYGKGMAVILAATFVLHLLLRARWIALVGVHSVYPDGIRWDKLRMGPILRGIESARARPFPEIIERADNVATIVFAVGVTLAIFVVPIALGAIGICALGIAVSVLTEKRVAITTVMMAVFALFLVPILVAATLDRRYGETLEPSGFARRAITRVLEIYARLGFSRTSNPIMASLGSHVSDSKMTITTMAVVFLALFGSASSLVVARMPERIGGYAWFPSAKTPGAMQNAYYDDQRDPVRDRPSPYIQSMVVESPYLRLVVPYRPDQDEPALRRDCAQVESMSAEQRAAARLACLQSLHDVMLDSKPIPGLRYEIGSDPRTDRPALVAMIDVRDLPRGRHELHVAHPLRADDTREDDPGFDRIPFWR